jgi:DDE family transposase
VTAPGEITAQDLRHWKLLDRFQKALGSVLAQTRLPKTFSDPRRELDCSSYLSLFLFGLFNPVVESMRSLCAVTALEKVQQHVGCGKVSLGSFSAAQRVLDPDLLKRVFEQLVEQGAGEPRRDPSLAHLKLLAQDGSLWPALPRLAWAEYGVGAQGQAKGVRLHLRFNILQDQPEDALITCGKGCETQALRDLLLPGQTTVADRYYGQDYQLMGQVDRAKAFFVFRVRESAALTVLEELPLSAEDRAAGVVRQAWVYLGATEKLRSIRVRLVEIKTAEQHLFLVTNHPVGPVPAALVSLIYRRRWSIELFFRWVKCILGCRHFFAESPEGVALQIYLALIAALLTQALTGQRPNKRVMEFLRLYLLGWASAEEVAALISQQARQGQKAKKA